MTYPSLSLLCLSPQVALSLSILQVLAVALCSIQKAKEVVLIFSFRVNFTSPKPFDTPGDGIPLIHSSLSLAECGHSESLHLAALRFE